MTDADRRIHAPEELPTGVSLPASPSFVIVGTPRSGTTLVQRLASELPGVCVPPETHFFDKFVIGLTKRRRFPLERGELSEELREYLALDTSSQLPLDASAVVETLGGRCESPLHLFSAIVKTLAAGAAICGEKTPDHLHWWRPLARSLPQLRIVAVVRDPRAVVASNRNMPWGRHPHGFLAEFWRLGAQDVAMLCASLPAERRLLLCYEDVVRRPHDARRRIGRLLGISDDGAADLDPSAAAALYQPREWWKEKVREPVSGRWVDNWRTELSSAEVRDIEAICQLEMQAFRYEASTGTPVTTLQPAVEEQRRLWRTWLGWTRVEVAQYERRFVGLRGAAQAGPARAARRTARRACGPARQ